MRKNNTLSYFTHSGCSRYRAKAMYFQLSRGTFASSTKYLMQSRQPYAAAFVTHLTFTISGIFLSSTKYFKIST
ncbi:unnamed protein product [Bathycoccus prasinos]